MYSACEVAGQHDRVTATGQEQLLALLGHAREGHVVQTQLVEHASARRSPGPCRHR